MPIVIPAVCILASASASATTGGASVVGTITACAGTFGVIEYLSGGFRSIWKSTFQSTQESQEHQASLRRQNEISKMRIADTTNTVTQVRREVNENLESSVAATTSTSIASQQLQQSVGVLVETHQHLEETMRASSEALTMTPQTLEKLSTTQQALKENTTRLEALNQQLNEKCVALNQAKSSLKKLSNTASSQALIIVQLKGSLEATTTENEELRRTIEHQNIKYKKLESAAKLADNNHQLFRRVAKDAASLLKENTTIARAKK